MRNLFIKNEQIRSVIRFQEFAFQMEIRIGKIGRISGSGFAGPFIYEFMKYSRFGLIVNGEKSSTSIYRIGKKG